MGARPSDSSSATSSLGASTRTRAIDSIRCSPPDSVAAELAPAAGQGGELVERPVERGGHAGAALRPAEREPEVLLDGEGGEHRPPLGRVGDAGPGEAVGGAPVRSPPSTRTAPAAGRTRPVATRATVVLPTPFGPSSATASPGCTASDTSNRARNGP